MTFDLLNISQSSLLITLKPAQNPESISETSVLC